MRSAFPQAIDSIPFKSAIRKIEVDNANPSFSKIKVYPTVIKQTYKERFQRRPCHREEKVRWDFAVLRNVCRRIPKAIRLIDRLARRGRKPDPGSRALPIPSFTDP